MDGLVFLVPDERFVVPADDVARLLGELELLDREDAVYDARGAGERINRAAELGTAADTLELEVWLREEVHALARALDHIRNASPHFPPPLVSPVGQPLFLLRDAVITVYQFGAVTYELSPLIAGREARERLFASYTGPYDLGDRLLYLYGEEYRVVGRADAAVHERLLVERFR